MKILSKLMVLVGSFVVASVGCVDASSGPIKGTIVGVRFTDGTRPINGKLLGESVADLRGTDFLRVGPKWELQPGQVLYKLENGDLVVVKDPDIDTWKSRGGLLNPPDNIDLEIARLEPWKREKLLNEKNFVLQKEKATIKVELGEIIDELAKLIERVVVLRDSIKD